MLDLVLHGSHAGLQMGRPGAGPAISLSFLLIAIACCFAALCYAELASMIPIAGSAYTYAYAILGEIFAWIIGWDLILEYAVSNMAVAVGFSAYLQDLLENVFGFHLPAPLAFRRCPRPGNRRHCSMSRRCVITDGRDVDPGARSQGKRRREHGWSRSRLPPFWFSVLARRTPSTRKLASVRCPTASPGVLTGASIVFFTYIGFDSVSTAAEECRSRSAISDRHHCDADRLHDPVRSVSLVLTGIARYDTLGTDSPVADALKALG